jgi:hypothetical protein
MRWCTIQPFSGGLLGRDSTLQEDRLSLCFVKQQAHHALLTLLPSACVPFHPPFLFSDFEFWAHTRPGRSGKNLLRSKLPFRCTVLFVINGSLGMAGSGVWANDPTREPGCHTSSLTSRSSQSHERVLRSVLRMHWRYRSAEQLIVRNAYGSRRSPQGYVRLPAQKTHTRKLSRSTTI